MSSSPEVPASAPAPKAKIDRPLSSATEKPSEPLIRYITLESCFATESIYSLLDYHFWSHHLSGTIELLKLLGLYGKLFCTKRCNGRRNTPSPSTKPYAISTTRWTTITTAGYPDYKLCVLITIHVAYNALDAPTPTYLYCSTVQLDRNALWVFYPRTRLAIIGLIRSVTALGAAESLRLKRARPAGV
ncbi:hypothetical protein B0J17DRAFT_629773 [Rhizoctonia solani]|nr:hypothetical protein B0J17DRAFT_629773 [Rhizoctonia solani]